MATNPTAPSSSNSPQKPSLSPEDMAQLKQVFTRFDANGDGKISVNELDTVLETLGTHVPPDQLKRVMEELDTDNDGFINLSEFAEFCGSDFAEGDPSELREAFDLYDQDKNDLISATELHLVLNRLGMMCSEQDCHNMIKSVDSDGDGNVNFEEFKKMMSNRSTNASAGP